MPENIEGNLNQDSLIILGIKVPTTTQMLPQQKLKFFVDNPRVYSIVRANGRQPSQEDIQEQLCEMEHVKELREDIKRNGGLLEPLIVRGGSFEVLEGNSRLAAYRQLASKEPIKWATVKCSVLPDDVDDALIFALLGQFHIKGKKDWAPYEQAGFLYRRFNNHKVPVSVLSTELGLGSKTVTHLIDTYQFMVDHDEVDISRWSYYDEYLKSNTIKRARKKHSEMDALGGEQHQERRYRARHGPARSAADRVRLSPRPQEIRRRKNLARYRLRARRRFRRGQRAV
jgi:hypothetical protein